MAELNDKLISYGNLSTFYDKLQEQGLGGNAIEDASVLPDASENKSKLIRLSSDDNVYVSELKSRTSTTTNRLPDEQQIDKAYLYNTDFDYILSYKGTWKFLLNDGEINGYGWLLSGNEWRLCLTQDSADNITNYSKAFYTDYNNGDVKEIDFENHTITIDDVIGTYDWGEAGNLDDFLLIPITAIYNAPESAQIGNANLDDKGEELNWIYDGTSVTLTIDDEQFTGYKWLSADAPYDYILTDKQASNIYFYEDNGTTYCDVKCYRVSNGDATSENILYIYIPQLNAPDNEQVDNATYTQTYDGGEGVLESTYLGEKNIQCADGVYLSHIWLQNGHSIDDLDNISLTKYSANSYYSAKNILRVYGGELWGIITVEDNEMYANNKTVAELSTIMDENESSWFAPNADSNVLSTVKYQRTEVTEEWDWQPLTDNATNDDIDLMFESSSPVVKRVLMKKAKLDEETEEPAYPLSLGEGLVNENDETMEWNGQTYYKWVLYEEREGVSSIDYSVDGEHPMIYLTTSLNPTLPFDRNSSECAYVIAMDGDKDDYSGSAKIYIKEALIHEDGSITYEE